MKYNFSNYNRPIVCAYISKEDPFNDKKAWSGLIYKIRESIEMAGIIVKWVPFVEPPHFLSSLYTKAMRILHPKKNDTGHSVWKSRYMGKSVDDRLLEDCDFIFIPSGCEILPYIKTKLPSIVYGDATFNIMVNYYFFNISKYNYLQGIKTERNALEQCDLVCKASNWAIDSVINDYNIPKEKCMVLEFGANIEDKDIVHINIYKEGQLNVLFSGVEWERKGAEIAIETVGILRKKGINARLLLCGIKSVPQQFKDIRYVDYIGFLDKNNPLHYKTYIETIKKSHILLLPTKAECAGIVFSEASGYGLPIYTFDTGGISNYVKNNVNGFRLSTSSTAEDFAEKIFDTLNSETQLKLQQGCLKLYNEHLSWKAWTEKFKKMIFNM